MKRAITAVALLLSSGCLYTVTWLADGSRLACYESGGVWLVNPKGEKTLILEAPGLDDVFLVAAPKGDRIALTGQKDTTSFLTVFTAAGKVQWTGTRAGAEWSLLPWFWSPDGKTVFFDNGAEEGKKRLALVASGAKKPHEIGIGGDLPRFSSDGYILSLRTQPGATTLLVDRHDTKGKLKKSLPWTMPAGYPDAEGQLLSDDGGKAWFRAKTGARTVLADRSGRIIREFEGEPEVPGPGFLTVVTRKNGFTLADAGSGAEAGLNVYYNRFIHSELQAQLNDPARSDRKFNPEDSNFFPVFAPDGKSFALHGNRRLYVADLSTGAISTLASW
jgi:Tol biopolymer transport system component